MMTAEGRELIERIGEENAPPVQPRLEFRTPEGVVLFVQEFPEWLRPGDTLTVNWKYEPVVT